MPRQWMTPQRPPRPRREVLARVQERLKRGASDASINQCCTECRQALRWIRGVKVPLPTPFVPGLYE